MYPRKLWRRLRALLARRRLDAELDEEIAFHLEMEAQRHAGGGLSTADARRRARLAFGAVEQLREATRDARGVTGLLDFCRDCRHGFRTLARRPVGAALLVLTLSLGIGGSAAIFNVVDGVLLSPLPYEQPDRIVSVWQREAGGGERSEVAPGTFLDWRARANGFTHLTAIEPHGLDWASPEGPVYLPTWLVYEGFFEAFGVAPLLGRVPRPDEHVASAGDVVVLGYEMWRTRFGGDPGVSGRVVTIDGRPWQVIGVMPRGFAMPSDAAVWAPKVQAGWEAQARRGGFYRVFGRLAGSHTRAAAESELVTITTQLGREHPAEMAGTGVEVVSLAETLVGPVRKLLLLLLGAVLLVFLVVVANAGSLELARAVGRAREFAVRGALGASRARLLRQRLAESLAVATVAAGLGFAVAWVSGTLLRAAVPADFPRAERLDPGGQLLGFAVLGGLLSALAVGVAPALLGAGHRPAAPGPGVRGGATRGIRRVQRGLVVIQVALCLTLLTGATLLFRSFVSLLGVDRGFDARGAVVLTVQSWDHYPSGAARIEFVRQATARLAAEPGVRAAGMSTSVPLMESIGQEHAPFTIDGRPAAGEPPFVQYASATPGFFRALGIPLRRGRWLTEADDLAAPRVALVNEAFARTWLDGADAVGVRVRLGPFRAGLEPVPVDIVGVVGDVRRAGLAEPAVPWIYLAHAQHGSGANAFVVAGSDPAPALLERARGALHEINPALAVHQETSMAALVGASLKEREFVLSVMAVFAAMALVLATAGLYALTTFVTEERTRELGVRVALGADRARVVRLVLRQSVGLMLTGLVAGLAGALAAGRLLGGLLFGVTGTDPLAHAGAAIVLLTAALLACWLPARRAAGTDPTVALRSE